MKPFSVVALLWNGPKVLAVSRKTDHADLGLPGGKIEPGETPEEAVFREVLEDTGLTLTDIKPVFDHLDRVEGEERRPCRCFEATWKGEARSMEGARVAWVSPRELVTPACSFADYNRLLFKSLKVHF